MAEIKYLEINADDRSIIIPAGENLLGVENDNEGARKYFRCPKIVGDNIDLTKSDVYINVQNASGEKSGKDRYPVQNMTASGDNVTFEWVLERKVTSHKGSVRFAVCVREKGTEREWHTTFATGNALEGEELFEPAELEARGQDFIGILTSDANADANSIESGKSAYVNGKKIKGTLTGENDIKATTKNTKLSSIPTTIPGYGQSTLPVLKHTIEVSLADANKPVLLKGGVKKTVVYDEAGSIYGDAKASDVRIGKTFTSSNGVKITGTLSVSAKTMKGTVTGGGANAVAFDTGLKAISCIVIMQTVTSTSDTGIIALLHQNGKTKGIGNSYSQYLKTSSTSTGTIAINGGEVTYTPKNGTEVTNMVDGKEYTWIAIGE
ncbi:hypothetical protein DXD67_13230 [Coprococcus comes]|uniref:Uncharacterized protein n=1 Tax=Coprococcus comes TaxID=410072 RepID=A0A3E4GMJ5_9FIRM|nr:hypothetical protein [Coprococcus comes]RGJ21376.1 hypothetical protein DXD67_13230 [Coprococcus comes]